MFSSASFTLLFSSLSHRKGWFPFSYTQPFPNTPEQDVRYVLTFISLKKKNQATFTYTEWHSFFPCRSSLPLLSKLNSTSTGHLDRLPPGGQLKQASPDSEDDRSVVSQRISTFRPRPYSMMNPDTKQLSPRQSLMEKVRINSFPHFNTPVIPKSGSAALHTMVHHC